MPAFGSSAICWSDGHQLEIRPRSTVSLGHSAISGHLPTWFGSCRWPYSRRPMERLNRRGAAWGGMGLMFQVEESQRCWYSGILHIWLFMLWGSFWLPERTFWRNEKDHMNSGCVLGCRRNRRSVGSCSWIWNNISRIKIVIQASA